MIILIMWINNSNMKSNDNINNVYEIIIILVLILIY